MMRFKLLSTLLLSGGMLAGALVGCDKGSTSSGPSAGGKLRIVYIPKNAGNPYFVPLTEGFKQAVEDGGCEFATVAPDTGDATSQLPILKDQIQQGVAAIAISPNSPDALNSVLEDAMGKGIPVVTVDSDLTGNEKNRSACVMTADIKLVGEGQIELLGSLINYQGKFAILSATTDAPNQNAWIAVMKETLKSNPKYAKMELLEVVYGNDDPQKSLTEAEALLTKHSDLRGIIAPTTVGVAAAAQVVESAKKADTIAVTGLGTPNQMRQFIKNGTVKAFALWNPREEGYLAGQLSVLLAKKSLTPTSGTTFDVKDMGKRTFGEKSIVITGPPTVFTKENIDLFHF